MSLYQASVAITVCDNLLPTIVGPHKAAPTPPVPPVPTGTFPHVESPATMMWALWILFGKGSKNVTHLGFQMILDGHDVGWMIPHVCIPPNNLLTPLIIAFSTRTTSFSAMTVKAKGTPIATAQLFLIPQPMMVCHEPISLPSGFSIFGSLQSVKLGMTLADLLVGVLTIGVSMLIDTFLAGGGKGSNKGSFWGKVGNNKAGWKEVRSSLQHFNPWRVFSRAARRELVEQTEKAAYQKVAKALRTELGREARQMAGREFRELMEQKLRQQARDELRNGLYKKVILGEFSKQTLGVGLARSVIKGSKNIPTEVFRMTQGQEGKPSIKLGGSGNVFTVKLGVKRTPGAQGGEASWGVVDEAAFGKNAKIKVRDVPGYVTSAAETVYDGTSNVVEGFSQLPGRFVDGAAGASDYWFGTNLTGSGEP